MFSYYLPLLLRTFYVNNTFINISNKILVIYINNEIIYINENRLSFKKLA